MQGRDNEFGPGARALASELEAAFTAEARATAWRRYSTDHKDEFDAECERLARHIRSGDVEATTLFLESCAELQAEHATPRPLRPHH